MSRRYKGYVFLIYDYETELPCAVCETADEMMTFFQKPNKDTLFSSVCHYLRGEHDFMTDAQKHKYKLYKVELEDE